MQPRKISKSQRLIKWFIMILMMVGPVLTGCREKAEKPEGVGQRFAVGVIMAYDSPTSEEALRGLVDRLEEYRRLSGKNVKIAVRRAGGRVAALPEIVRELALDCDLLVPVTTPALQAAMIASAEKPVVFCSVANPYIVRAGRTAVDHDPRVTGVCSTAPLRQVLELISQVLPGKKRIGTIWTPSEINSEYYWQLMREAAGEFGLEMVSEPINGAGDIVQAIQSLVREKVQVLFPVSDNTINANFRLVASLADENRLPLFAAFSSGAELGACASMGFGFYEIGQKAGELVARIFNGESPARIPFQYIDRVIFVINEDAAARQGVNFPPQMLKKADRILRDSAGEKQNLASE